MKKAVFTAPGTIDFVECPVPEIAADQVLLKVMSIGVCGSDVQMYNGKHRYMTYPVVPGHEVSAVVEQVGSKVADFQPGDRVTVQPQIFCGKCYPCTIGRFNVCEQLKVKGVHADGFAAEYVAIEPSYLHLCPPDMDFDRIVLVEPAAVAVGAVKRAQYKGATIAVIGAGPIGNLVAQAAQAMGAEQALLTDILDSRLDFARQCGIQNCLNTAEMSLQEAIEQTFGSRKADVIIDAAATSATFAAALEASRPSSEIVITGNYKNPVELEVPRIQRREVALIGHMMYVREDYAEAIKLLAEGKIRTEGFITQRYGLADFHAAFKQLNEHPEQVMKAVLEVAAG